MSAPLRLADWDQLSVAVPDMVATMRRYLDQLDSILRPGSVSNADQALRSLATFLTERAPEVTSVAGIGRRHLEDFRLWLAAVVSGRSGAGAAAISGTRARTVMTWPTTSRTCHGVQRVGRPGLVAAVGNSDYGQCDVADWREIVAVAAGSTHTLGLRADGTVVAAGNNEHGQCGVTGWDAIRSHD